MLARAVLLLLITSMSPLLANTNKTAADIPPIEPGVSLELARWRAARYSDVRYKLNLTLEKMSPVLKGTMEIRVNVSETGAVETGSVPPIILDWRNIKGHEEKSTISNVSINGRSASRSADTPVGMSVASTRTNVDGLETSIDKDSFAGGTGDADKSVRAPFEEHNEHLIFRDGVVMGENVIKMDFTSPILTSGSAITRYVDKEDGSEYIYSLFVPSDASTAFPVFDQPDLKARFKLTVATPESWRPKHQSANASTRWHVVSNTSGMRHVDTAFAGQSVKDIPYTEFDETKPISTYVFAFAAGPFEKFEDAGGNASVNERATSPDAGGTLPNGRVSAHSSIYGRKSQAEKFKPHAAEVFRLNREAIKYFEEYFDYEFPFPKYDLVLIPEFPFGGMEHAGATFLRESSIIFPQEPTKNDHISRALLIFHEASHQWFGDTVTMRWFDDLWLKEGFATFTAYKAMERIMPEMMAWKVFYERVKQAAYRTDSTKGTTPIYQEINNLSAAKSAYGAIVYSKAPAFLRQAEFYLGEDKFQTAVRSFLKKHEFGNAGWEDLVEEFQDAGWQRSERTMRSSNAEEKRRYEEVSKNTIGHNLNIWIVNRGAPLIRMGESGRESGIAFFQWDRIDEKKTADLWTHYFNVLFRFPNGSTFVRKQFLDFEGEEFEFSQLPSETKPTFVFPNYQDYGYGIFLLDEKSRDYVLKNIQNEKDPFLRSMMWGALWDSVREGELDPREYVELVVRVLSTTPAAGASSPPVQEGSQEDESTTALLLSRVGTAMNYYIDPPGGNASVNERAGPGKGTLPNGRVSARESLAARVENLLIDRMQDAETQGQRITFYRAFLNIASSENARSAQRAILKEKMHPSPNNEPNAGFKPGLYAGEDVERIVRFEEMIRKLPLKTKDKFDIVTRLLILGDPEAPGLLAELEKTETGDEALRYAYAARAGIATAENKAKYWRDFTENKEISESWIEAAFGPFNSIRHADLTLPYLERALKELPNHKRDRKIFFVNGWLGAFIGGQRSEEALAIVNKFLADNPGLDNDLRLKILENADTIERAVRIRAKY